MEETERWCRQRTIREPMPTLECPRLRPGLTASHDENDPRYVYVWDQLRLANRPQRFSLREFTWIQLLDGRRCVRDVQVEAMRQAGGEIFSLELLITLVRRLDDAFLLESPRFRDRLSNPIREPSCLGCYA